MSTSEKILDSFQQQLHQLIDDNIENEQFGVSELADQVGMSRSNLLRKVKKETGLSVSQFIRNRRLERSMELLKAEEFTISEIAFKVGFGSVSYYIKCFREVYGYSPGEANNQTQKPEAAVEPNSKSKKLIFYLLSAAAIITSVVIFFIFLNPGKSVDASLEKSIAVLPFKNDSDDESNLHIINGLMESTLNHLQKIEALRVISRTSVEKYRNSSNTIPELSQLLNVNYFVEGSGQKVANDLLVTIQLIEARSDKHLWSKQYRRKVDDIFDLQAEISQDIARQIQVIIAPEVLDQIVKKPTENLAAYEWFIKGKEASYLQHEEGLQNAVGHYQNAINEDPDFALAHAELAITYYFLDMLLANKNHTEKINKHADKALLLDPELVEALIAKGFYYINIRSYDNALPPLLKALEHHPNEARIINTLADYYYMYNPNTSKYLEYALKGLKIAAPKDSATASLTYLHIANALSQTGFIADAKKYVEMSLQYNPENIFTMTLQAYINFSEHLDLDKVQIELLEILEMDTTRLDVLQELARITYQKRDYDSAYFLYEKLVEARQMYQLNIYHHLDVVIADVYRRHNEPEKAAKMIDQFERFCENDHSMYQSVHQALFHVYHKEYEKANDYYEQFAEQGNFIFWLVRFWDTDPMMDEIKKTPRFQRTMKKIEAQFWKDHQETRSGLVEQGLI